VVPQARDVGEPQVQDLDVVLLDELHYLFRVGHKRSFASGFGMGWGGIRLMRTVQLSPAQDARSDYGLSLPA
jgi:hypothetical protein